MSEGASSAWFQYLKDYIGATDEELVHLTRLHELKSKARASGMSDQQLDSPSVIIDGFLYHGDGRHAVDVDQLRKLNIRHILSVWDLKLKKDTLTEFNVLRINLKDTPLTNIRQHFEEANEFLTACRSKNERVLVHCHMGVSRSACIVLAYLLKYHHRTLHDAYDHLLTRRHVVEPNDGFILQLIRYEKDLNVDA